MQKRHIVRFLPERVLLLRVPMVHGFREPISYSPSQRSCKCRDRQCLKPRSRSVPTQECLKAQDDQDFVR
jgi:hypothetical protein